MYLLHPKSPLKLSFGSNCNLSSLIPIQCCRVAKNSVPRCVSCSHIKIKWTERKEGFQKHYIRFSHDCGLKKQKSIYLRDFKDVDFNFTHFANFKFAYFEIEVSFRLTWLNLQNGRFHLQISILGTQRCSFLVQTLFLLILCMKEIFGKFG